MLTFTLHENINRNRFIRELVRYHRLEESEAKPGREKGEGEEGEMRQRGK